MVVTSTYIRNELQYVNGYRYLKCEDFYDDPVSSMENMGILLASNLSSIEETFLVDSITRKFFRLPFEDKYVLLPLLHLS